MSEEKKPLAPGVGAEARKLNEAFDKTGVSFHDRAAALAALKSDGREIVFDDAGEPSVLYDNHQMPLSDALLRLGYDRRELVDGRTLPRQGVGASRPGLASKEDFKTVREKLDWIAANGADAWERLPLTGVQSAEVRTKQDWYKLPRAEKVRLTALDPNYFDKLPSAPAVRQHGAFINVEGIERQKAIRGKK